MIQRDPDVDPFELLLARRAVERSKAVVHEAFATGNRRLQLVVAVETLRFFFAILLEVGRQRFRTAYRKWFRKEDGAPR